MITLKSEDYSNFKVLQDDGDNHAFSCVLNLEALNAYIKHGRLTGVAKIETAKGLLTVYFAKLDTQTGECVLKVFELSNTKDLKVKIYS